MKMLKRTLSVFLAILMLTSCMSMSFEAFAAEARSDEDYRALAYSFFNYTVKTSGHTSSYVVNTDANGYPVRSIVGDLDHYTISNASGEYVYADDDENPIRAISFDHKVTAKDNSSGLIMSAATAYLALAEKLMSTEYGIGLYTIPMVADAVAEALKFTKGDDGNYLFLDGYTYLVNAVGEIKDRSPEPTYKVVDGEIVELEADDAWLEPYADTMSSYTLMNLFDFCHVSTIIDYFSGNCTSINSGNWYHSFVFYCATDLDTVLVSEPLTSNYINMQSLTVEWKMRRQYDDSGTVPQYFNDGFKTTKSKPVQDYTRRDLVQLQSHLTNYFSVYLAPGYLSNLSHDSLEYHYGQITEYYNTFNSISNAAKIAVFGQAAYSYMNLVTQLTPIVDSTDVTNSAYWPKHTYEKYKDATNKNVVYTVDAQKVTSVVSTIDDLLKSERVGTILKQFMDYTDPEYENMAYYQDAQNAKTAQDILKVFIADFVYQDSIVNMLLELLYPMVCNLLDDLLTDAFVNNLLETAVDGVDLSGLVDAVVNQGDGWLATIYGALSSIGVTLTPAGMAYTWDTCGYLTDNTYLSALPNLPQIYEWLKLSGGGIKSSGLHSTGSYNAIGSERDNFYGDRWGYFRDNYGFENIVWGINGDQYKFKLALDAILAPIAPLLAVLFGDGDCTLRVANVLGTELDLLLNNDDVTHNYYNTILLPLFEVLGIPDLLTGEEFESRASQIISASNRTSTKISAFLNDGLLTPILNWVNNVLLADPIGTIVNLLPNLSYYLTSGALLGSVRTLKVPIIIKHAILFIVGGSIEVYELDVLDLIGEDTLAFLDSVQGIIDLIGFDVDTGIPLVGYYAEGNSMVYAPDQAGYNPDVHKIGVTEAFMSSDGLMNRYKDSEFNTLIKGIDENGEYTQYAIRNVVGYANLAGNVVTEHTTEAPESEYNTPVKGYYSYTVVKDVTTEEKDENGDFIVVQEETTYRVVNKAMIPADILEAGEYDYHESVVNEEVPASLPPIMDNKLQAVGTLTTVYSKRYGEFKMDSGGWGNHLRNYIDVQVQGMETEGLVFLFLFRYIFSALMYRTYDSQNQDFTSPYTLLDAFGLGGDMLTDDLFAGLRLQDIIDNVVLNPDGAIAALFELLYKNEFGSLYKLDENGKVVPGDRYSYAPEYVDYHVDEIFGYADEYEDYSYGTTTLYSEYWTKEKAVYIADNLDDIAEAVFSMLKLEGADSVGEFLEGFVSDLLFTNEMLSTIAAMLYGLLSDLGGSIDIPGILDAALDVDLSKQNLADALVYEFGDAIKSNGVYVEEDGTETPLRSVYTQLVNENIITASYEAEAQAAHNGKDYDSYREYKALALESSKYTDNTFYKMVTDAETGEVSQLYSYDWGYNNPTIKGTYSDPEIFLKALSAIASPFAFIFKFLFAGEDLSLLNLITIPSYEVYHYAWTPLFETLGGEAGLESFEFYFTKLFAGESTVAMNCDTIYYTLKPLIAFVEKVLDNPVEVVLNLLPNLLFFINIGGLNGVLNNLVHFAYVLLDILSPIFNAYPLVNSLLGNLNIGGMQLNLSLPLDFDFNQLINQLLEGLLGETLAFDIENPNIILGTQEVEKEFFIPQLDEEGNEMLDEEGNVIGTFETRTVTEDVYAVGTLKITLPYIDLSTLCAGTVELMESKSGHDYIKLNSAGGADLITLIFRIVTDTLFFEDNAINIANFLIGFSQLDDEDNNDELLLEIMTYLNAKAKTANIPDVIMNLLYTLFQLIVPLAGELGARFERVDFSITDLFDGIDDLDLTMDRIKQLLSDGTPNPTMNAFGRLIELIKQFFEKIAAFFNGLFG